MNISQHSVTIPVLEYHQLMEEHRQFTESMKIDDLVIAKSRQYLLFFADRIEQAPEVNGFTHKTIAKLIREFATENNHVLSMLED